MLIDTSGLYAALDRSDQHHAASVQALARADAPLRLSPFILAELDYLVCLRLGLVVARALLEEVARGVYSLESFGQSDLARANAYIDRYPGIGLADASLLTLADRFGAYDVLSWDQRHFRNIEVEHRKKLRLIPLDSN